MLKLDELFKLFEEVEKSDLLFEAEEKEFFLDPSLYQVHISDKLASKGEGTDNQRLRDAVLSGLGRSASPATLLNTLNTRISNLEKDLEDAKNPKQRSISALFSRLVLVDAIIRLFNDFQAQATGWLNEPFIAAFYGATAEHKAAAGADDVADLVAQGTHYSIKTLSKTSPVKGSIQDIKTSISKSNKPVYFHVYEKIGSDPVTGIVLRQATIGDKEHNIPGYLDISEVQKNKDGNQIRILPTSWSKWPQVATLNFDRNKTNALIQTIEQLLSEDLKSAMMNVYNLKNKIYDYAIKNDNQAGNEAKQLATTVQPKVEKVVGEE